MGLCYKSHYLFPGDICEHDSVLTQENTASGGRGGWTILPSCSASTTPDKISQEVLGDTPGDGSGRLELDNTFLSARQITLSQRTNSALPSAPATATCSPFSSHLFSRVSIYVTHLCHLCSNTAFLFPSLNPQLLSRLFSCLDDSTSPLRSKFHPSLFPSEFHCVTTSLAHHSKQSFFFSLHLLSPHHIK